MSAPVALVTGGTGGIGRAIVRRLIADGYQVLTVGRHREKLLLEDGCKHITADVSDERSVTVVYAAVPCAVPSAGRSDQRCRNRWNQRLGS